MSLSECDARRADSRLTLRKVNLRCAEFFIVSGIAIASRYNTTPTSAERQ